MKKFDYVVLGAGLGGLSAAACLAQQGKRVAVLEQHYLPGGCCHTFERGDYRFCADVHYVSQCGEGEAVDRFLNYIEREISFKSLDPDCIDRVITPDVDFRIPLGWEKFRDRLLITFPEETAAINRYCDEVKRLHQEMSEINEEMHWYDLKPADWLKLPKHLNLFSKRLWTLQDLYDHVGLSPKLQDLLAGQSGDYALPPKEISLISHVSLVSSYAIGAYYPQHHFKHLVDTIVEKITASGGVVLLSTPVEHIEVKGGEVQFVIAGGVFYHGEAYISDLDPKRTVELMHSEQALSLREQHRLTDYDYSTSAFNIYLGLDSRFDPTRYGIGNWNIWYYPNGNLNQSYERQFAGDLDNPWIFLSCPTMKSAEPGMAPAGHHILEISTVCPYELFKVLHEGDPKKDKEAKKEVYQLVMASVRDLIPDIDDYIRVKLYGTPTTSEHFLGQPEGNIYGANLTPSQVGLRRIGYRTELSNLFLVGASAGYPSVPGVIGNGMNVVELLTGNSITPLAATCEPVSLRR